MLRMIAKTDWRLRSEEQASRHINIVSHYSDDTLLDKSGKLIQIIKLQGIDAVTEGEETLDRYKNRRNNLLKNFSSEFALYFWEVRRKKVVFPEGNFESGFAHDMNEAYKKKIAESNLYYTDLYLAIITKPAEGIINLGFNWVNYLNHAVNKTERQHYLVKQHQALSNAARKIISTLADYKPRLLSVYEKNEMLFSEPLEFLSQLLNFDSVPVPLDINNAAIALPRHRLFFNHKAGVIEMRLSDGSHQFTAMLSLKAYQPVTYQGMLDEVSRLKMEYTLTQSYRFYDRHVAKTRLRDQQKEMRQTKDESITQTEQISEAFDDAASGEVGYGAHHLTIACFADSLDELNKNIAAIISRFSDIDVVSVRETVGSECAFWAQFPGNFSYVLRAADISTKNMAAFMSLHNSPMGKIKGNHWGDAVTILETQSGSPYYFNFHYKDVGNFLVFGAMGSGKTVLMGFLILQSMKFGGKRIIFDKDRGLEILVRAMNGVYERLKPGIPTGFNPCQLPDTSENRKFLSSLFKKLLTVNGETFIESDAALIEHVIDGMYRLERSERQFRHIASFFGAKKPGSLRNRFDQWHSDGAHAWLFDHVNDTLNLDPNILGFDLGHILADTDCKTPALMYLMYRVSAALYGHRGLLFFDEGWMGLSDPYFTDILNDWSRTPRKKDNIFGMATQVANDTVKSAVSQAINESAFCKIFFPNPSADRHVYINELGLSEREYQLVKTMPDDQHYFLLNYGRGANKESVILRLNLTGMDDLIAVISAREKTLQLLDEIRRDVEGDYQNWLPLFHIKRKEKFL